MFQTYGIKVKKFHILDNGHHLTLVAFTDVYGRIVANKFPQWDVWIVSTQEKSHFAGLAVNYAEIDSIGKKAQDKTVAIKYDSFNPSKEVMSILGIVA